MAGADAGLPPPTKLPKKGDPNALYVVDLSGYVFRSYHAVAPLSNTHGEPTHAVYGTANMLHQMLRERDPAHVAIAMDSPTKSFRHTIDPNYKANRPPPPPDLSQQMQRCEQLVRTWQLPTFRKDGFEADDIIASIITYFRAHSPDFTIVIASADKDLMQLVDDRVLQWDSLRNKVYGALEVQGKLGVPPSQVRDLLALMGDSSDNVPGVESVGPKTAIELLAQFGSLDSIYERLGEVKRDRLRQMLEQHRENAYLSQKLVTLDRAVDIELSPQCCRRVTLSSSQQASMRALLNELEFTRLLPSFPAITEIALPFESAPATERDPQTESAPAPLPTIPSPPPIEPYSLFESIEQVKFALENKTLLALTLTTIGEDIIGIAFATDADHATYAPILHRGFSNDQNLSWTLLQPILASILGNSTVTLVLADSKNDIRTLEQKGLQVAARVFDITLAHYLNDPEAPHELPAIAMSLLSRETPALPKMSGKSAASIDQIAPSEVCRALAEPAAICMALYQKLSEQIDSHSLAHLLYEIEQPLARVLSQMEHHGVLVDVRALADVERSISSEIAECELQSERVIGRTGVNLDSPKQLETLLFDELKMPSKKRTKTGRSTDASVLEALDEQGFELPKIILHYRQLAKLKNTYLEVLPKLVSPRDGRIHTTYQQHSTATGRISSIDPNLQNIPVRSAVGRSIRRAFIAPPGFLLLSADYSQIELRVLAHLSRDPILTKAFIDNEDVHARTAKEIFNITESSPDFSEARRRAKAVNFGVIYGQGENALARSLGIRKDEAGDFIARYFERYQGVETHLEELVAHARAGEFVQTICGRRRYLPDISSGNRSLRLAAERIAKNTPIQGSAADILKLAMLALANGPVKNSKMVLTVHDELIFEIPIGSEDDAKAIVADKMSKAIELSVPLVVDCGVGPNWASAKKA